MDTCYHYTTRYQIGGILRDREINKRKHKKTTPEAECFNWFTTSPILEFGSAFGAHFEPPGGTLAERIRVFGNMINNPAYALEKRLQLYDAVLASEPYRIGVNADRIAWDVVQGDGPLIWYGVLRPVQLSEWVSFEQLKGGTRDRWTNAVSGSWIGMPLAELTQLINEHVAVLKASDPPWRDFYKHFEQPSVTNSGS